LHAVIVTAIADADFVTIAIADILFGVVLVARDVNHIDTPLDHMFRPNKNSNTCCGCYFEITGLYICTAVIACCHDSCFC
jgi:hypothetical protein